MAEHPPELLGGRRHRLGDHRVCLPDVQPSLDGTVRLTGIPGLLI